MNSIDFALSGGTLEQSDLDMYRDGVDLMLDNGVQPAIAAVILRNMIQMMPLNLAKEIVNERFEPMLADLETRIQRLAAGESWVQLRLAIELHEKLTKR